MNLKKSINVSLAKAGYNNLSEFCRKTGMKEVTLKRIKSVNSASTSTLNAFCDHMGISLTEFLDNGK